MSRLNGRTLFIADASRGIGKATAVRAAKDGASVVIAAKTAAPPPTSPLSGTIYTTAEAIEAAGGQALLLVVDVRDPERIAQAVVRFCGIDICVNNASAIQLTSTLDTPMKRFDLMFGVNVRHLRHLAGVPAPPADVGSRQDPQPGPAADLRRALVRPPTSGTR